MSRTKPLILLTGVTGQLGHELADSFKTLATVFTPKREQLDLADPDSIRRVVREVRPTLIVNPAAYTAVDQAEREESLAMLINGNAPGILAEEGKRLGAPVLHFSTDYVFDGLKRGAYLETDATGPVNSYGASKLAGEQALEQVGAPYMVFRTSWVYSLRGRNFLLTMLRLAGQNKILNVVSDQIGAPTWTRTIAHAVTDVIVQGFGVDVSEADWWEAHSGIYNLTARGSVSWAGFAKAIFEITKFEPMPIVNGIRSTDYVTIATRPANSILCVEKLLRTFAVRTTEWRNALELCLSERVHC